MLDPIGTSRLPNYQNVDFHIERPVHVGTVRFVPALDVFNLLAPRVMRFGIKFNW